MHDSERHIDQLDADERRNDAAQTKDEEIAPQDGGRIRCLVGDAAQG